MHGVEFLIKTLSSGHAYSGVKQYLFNEKMLQTARAKVKGMHKTIFQILSANA